MHAHGVIDEVDNVSFLSHSGVATFKKDSFTHSDTFCRWDKDRQRLPLANALLRVLHATRVLAFGSSRDLLVMDLPQKLDVLLLRLIA